MVYHIFNYCIQDVWNRDSTSCSDEHFDRTMCALDWKVPANIKIFHYGSPGPTPYELVNPVLLCRPILSIDPLALAEARIHQNVSVYDKHSHHVWPVLRRLGRFVIYQGSNGWPRFSFVDGERLSIIVAMDVTPVTLKDALSLLPAHLKLGHLMMAALWNSTGYAVIRHTAMRLVWFAAQRFVRQRRWDIIVL